MHLFNSITIMAYIIIFVFWCFALVHGISQTWDESDTRKRINKEAVSGLWHSIELPLDHFNVLDDRTFRLRYITNDQFYKKGGPIIGYIGGEWEIEEYGVMGGIAFQLARQHNGYLFYPEHRYFGKSFPFARPVSVENLRYITPDHVLADLAYMISHIKETVDGLKESQVLVCGSSYAGALAVWARLKYPHLIDIAYICGGVTGTDTFDSDYYDVNYRSLKKINPKCAALIKAGVAEAVLLEKSQKGKEKLEALLPDLTCPGDNAYFRMVQRIVNTFNSQVWPLYKATQVCHYLVTNTTGSALERLSQAIPYTIHGSHGLCDVGNYREWFYMVCTFVGGIQITNSTNFGNVLLAEERLKRACTESYGPRFNQDFVNEHTHRSMLLDGGITPDVTKVLSTQGTHDPWYPHCILDDLNDQTPVVYIEDANHCLEIGEEQDDETPQVAQSKTEILEQLAKWLR